MRDVILEGVEDKIRINLGGDVSLVAEIQRIGRSLDWLVSEVELTGEEVLNSIDSIQFGPMKKPCGLEEDLIKDHHYILTAFDD